MKYVGEALKYYTSSTEEDEKQVVCIGIASWFEVKNRYVLKSPEVEILLTYIL